MDIHWHPFTVHKRIPLTISRGTSHGSTNIWLRLQQDGIEGWGEATSFSIGERGQSSDAIATDLASLAPALKPLHPLDGQSLEDILSEAGVGSATRAALDIARHDWLGKRAGLPLWQLWGLDRRRIGPTSVTIGISSPAAASQRLQDWLQQGPIHAVKVKLGSPDGIVADQAMLSALRSALPATTKVSVDANGGWSLPQALTMAQWLADQGVSYLEQPLAPGWEADLYPLHQASPLPLFVDESCFTSQDIPPLADRVHGINIKLMKSGGLSEALRMIHTARACGLQVMFGCYSDSSLANTALAQLSPLATHLDLDSHLNLKDDPFSGADFHDGHLIPNSQPGLGLSYHAPHP
ncbi:o-succinylbenzoate synthase [Halomicronema hongdechloris C2206]|uniref:Dipeptide epimerase n=1 Tax=Halomicronema hongdechloris C2206 TaxID=1641165 RepID=A0A1Z3HVJ8_9CYAN|nr:dipeptide epimerase [Halomicronema hongdechloris]ASC74295.1 o-succinylbenzoate synthase [Halomicronema hongdechloris C2206]